jgi:hypothetical protein
MPKNKDKPIADCCRNCMFVREHPHHMYCHRYPPKHTQTNSGQFNQFPRVFSTDWCGEFKHRPASNA